MTYENRRIVHFPWTKNEVKTIKINSKSYITIL